MHRQPAKTPTKVSTALPDTPISVVIPCFQEEDSVGQLLEKLSALQTRLPQYEFRFIIVDDGSQDSSVEVIQDLIADLPQFTLVQHEQNRGITAAIMTGLAFADTEICCSMDFDCSYEPEQFEHLIPRIVGADLVTASPYHPEGRVLNVPAWRLAISRCASFAYGLVMRQKLHTYTSCFRVYRRRSVVDLDIRNDGFVGVAELLWRLDQSGGKIVEFPATLNIRQFGQSKMRVIEVTLEHLGFLAGAMFHRLSGGSTPPTRPSQLETATPPSPSPEDEVSTEDSRDVLSP